MNRTSISQEDSSRTLSTNSIPGLHIIANFVTPDGVKITAFDLFKKFIEAEIHRLELQKVGEVYHCFPNGGFTAVICLTESHLSIHTWPEKNFVTFDVFLSNYLKDNRKKTHFLYRSVLAFFDAEVSFEQLIER